MRLSICMMVKDEEKNLRRCLESLKLLLDEPCVELIIVDTGSKDTTVDIAKEYTKKLYFHPWNNSFSDMRNITISYAKGEWIFIVDADEELKNPEELIELINDSRIDKFNTIMLREKEAQKIRTLDQSVNAELFNTSRLFKNDGEFKYIGNVHNQPVFKEPIFLAQNILLNHYGYDISDKELMDKKFKRTSELLKNEIKKDPKNVYYRYQLSVSYSMHGEKIKAWREIQKAYDLIKNVNDKVKYSYIYNKYAVFGYAQGKYEKIINVCKDGISVRPDYVDLYFFAAEAMENIYNVKEAVNYYKKYLDIMDDFENSTFVTDFSVVLHTAVVESQDYACEKVSTYYMNNDDYSEALKYAKEIKENNNSKVKLFLNIYLKFGKYSELKYYYLNLEHNWKKYLIFELEEYKKKLDKVKIENIENVFSELEDEYGLLNTIRCEINKNCNIITSNEIQNIEMLNFNVLENYYGDIIYQLLKTKYKVYDILQKCYELKLNGFFEYLYDKYNNLSEVIYNYIIDNEENYKFNEIRINKALGRYLVAFNKLDDEQFYDIFKRYIRDGIKYITKLYNENIILKENIYDLKSDEEAFFIYMYKAEVASDKEKVNYMSKALRIFPEMNKGVEFLLDEFQEKQNAINSEMDNLKIKLKENIKTFIENHDINNAEALIKEYESIVSDDMEIVLFKSEISIMRLKNINGKSEYKM